jgi:hypothetical protein
MAGARLGDGEAPRRAFQQALAGMRLQLRDGARHRGRRTAEPPRGSGERSGLHHCDKDRHRLEPVHSRFPILQSTLADHSYYAAL